MKKLFQTVSVSIVIIIYVISVLEVRAFGVENTFFDEYDTYIEGKQQTIESSAGNEKKKDNEKIQLEQQFFTATVQEYSQSFLITFNYQKSMRFVQSITIWKRKLFIFYSSFLI